MLEPAYKSAHRRAANDAYYQHQRKRNAHRQIGVSDKDACRKARHQHLTGDTDIEKSRFKRHGNGKRCENHRREHIEHTKQVCYHTLFCRVVWLWQNAAALKEAGKRGKRIFAHYKQNNGSRQQTEQNCKNRHGYRLVAFVSQHRRKAAFKGTAQSIFLFLHLDFTPIIYSPT